MAAWHRPGSGVAVLALSLHGDSRDDGALGFLARARECGLLPRQLCRNTLGTGSRPVARTYCLEQKRVEPTGGLEAQWARGAAANAAVASLMKSVVSGAASTVRAATPRARRTYQLATLLPRASCGRAPRLARARVSFVLRAHRL